MTEILSVSKLLSNGTLVWFWFLAGPGPKSPEMAQSPYLEFSSSPTGCNLKKITPCKLPTKGREKGGGGSGIGKIVWKNPVPIG